MWPTQSEVYRTHVAVLFASSNVGLLEEPGAGHEVLHLLLEGDVLLAAQLVPLHLPVLPHQVKLVPGVVTKGK